MASEVLQSLKVKKTGPEREKEDGNSRKKVIKFRNYNPHTEELKEHKMKRTIPDSIERRVSEQVESGEQAHVQEVNLSNLAPKKADWDLKRDISKKLEVLERQTQRAVIELIRERLKDDSEGLALVYVAGVVQERAETDD